MRSHRLLAGAAALVIIGVALYAPLWHAGFVYDDFWRIVQNPAVRSIHPITFLTDRVTVALRESGLVTDIYNPLTTLSFAIDFHAFHLSPLPYHLENLAFHLFNVLLLGWTLWRLGKNPWVAWIAALIFLVHPAQVQSVAWISQRSTVLSASALLGALAFLTVGSSGPALLAGIGCYLVALFSKETAVTFPLLFAIIVWWSAQHYPKDKRGPVWRRAGLVIVSLLAMTFMFFMWRAHVLGQWSQQAEGFSSLSNEWALGVLALPVYVGKLIVPFALRPSYLYPDISALALALASAVWLGWILLVWRLRPKYPVIAAGLVWIVVALLPALHLLSLRTFVGERFLYLPMIGFSVLIAAAAERSRASRVAVYLWILFLMGTTARALPAWHDESSLWAAAVRADPRNSFAQACYAGTLRQPQDAIDRYQLVLSLHPADNIRVSTYVNLAHLYLVQQRPQDALEFSRKALSEQPGNLNALFDVCLALAATGQENQARLVYRKLLANPETPAGLLAALSAELQTHGIQAPETAVSKVER